MAENYLYNGDNLDIMRRYIKDESVDLIYLDPPFNSNQDYNVLFAEKSGVRSSAQIKAFEDTWKWDQVASETYQEVVEAGGKPSEALQAFHKLLGTNDMLAYLAMMAPRLMELKRVLKSTESIYLHCDSTASHYLKVLMDAIFDPRNFRNEIIWRRTTAHGSQRSFGPIHDTILFYVKTNDYFFQVVKRPYMRRHIEERYIKDESGQYKFHRGGNMLTGSGATQGESGFPWRSFNPSTKNRHWAIPGFLAEQMPPEFERLGVLAKLDALYEAGLIEIRDGLAWPQPMRYLQSDDGQPLQDIWAYQPYTEGTVYGTKEGIDHDVAWLGPINPERLGYQTQKPLGLLKRIIQSSCPKEGIVLDPFCGCGTTIAAAQKLGRRWIGIDITTIATNLIKTRLLSAYGEAITKTYKVRGEPTTFSEAQALAELDKYQFQWWALGLVGARRTEEKKGADQGIDGRLYFHDEREGGKTKQVIFSVKGGHTNVKDVRDLRGVIEREKAELGVLITMQESTQPMRTEASGAGFYQSPWGKHPRLQILTIADLLDGKRVDMPPLRQVNVTFKQAPKARSEQPEMPTLPF